MANQPSLPRGLSRMGTGVRAVYRSLTTQTREPTQDSKSTNLDALPSVVEESTNVQRPKFDLNNDKELHPTMHIIKSYLDSTGLLENWTWLLNQLLHKDPLPFNPYPTFARWLRQQGESFHIEKQIESEEQILSQLKNATEESESPYIVSPVGYDNIWGLKSVVEVLNPETLRRYEWLIQDIMPKRHSLLTYDDYSNEVMCSLVGDTIFHGSFVPTPSCVQVKVEYLISGPDIDKGIEMFVKSVLRDVMSFRDPLYHHILLELHVPIRVDDDSDIWQVDIWEILQIEEYPDDFNQAVFECVTANKYFHAEYFYKLAPQIEQYVYGQKQYCLHFIKMETEPLGPEDNSQKVELISFSEFPLDTLYGGIFMNKAHAESYLMMFAQTLEQFYQNVGNVNVKKSNKVEDKSQKKGWFGAAKKPVLVDGFRNIDKDLAAPNVWQITAPIKSRHQMGICQLHQVKDLFEILHSLLLLVMIDRDAYGEDLLVDIYKVYRSSAYSLHVSMVFNRGIQRLIAREANLEKETSEFVNAQYKQYANGLDIVLGKNFFERSSDIVSTNDVIQYRLEQALNLSYPGQVELSQSVVNILVSVRQYITTLFMHLVEDAMGNFPNISKVINELKGVFPEHVPKPKTAEMTMDPQKPGAGQVTQDMDYKHGAEVRSLILHDMSVLNVDSCVEAGNAPEAIGGETVLLKYLLEIHLDEMWNRYLFDLLSGDYLPPNPFPRLVTLLREAAMRMDLHYEKEESICKRLVNRTIEVEDEDTKICTIPGSDLHGLESAVTLMDTGRLLPIVPQLKQLANHSFPHRKGMFRIAMCVAINGLLPMFGGTEPYIHQVELHEHCYIKGPKDSVEDAINIYGKIVYDHIAELNRKKLHPIIGTHMNGSVFTVEEMIKNKTEYMEEFNRNCFMKNSIVLKCFIRLDWRYVLVTKYFMFHFINEDETELGAYFDSQPAMLYRNVFFNKDKALFHLQKCGKTLVNSNPYHQENIANEVRVVKMSLQKCRKEGNFVMIHRWLLMLSLIEKNTKHIAEASRMLHSIATRLEYVADLCTALIHLADILLYEQSINIPPPTSQSVKTTDDTAANTAKQGAVDIVTVNRMAAALKQKLNEVSRSKTAMAPICLSTFLDDKIKEVTVRDEVTKDISLVVNLRTKKVLGEIRKMLLLLRDSTSYNVHCTSPVAKETMSSIDLQVDTLSIRTTTHPIRMQSKSNRSATHTLKPGRTPKTTNRDSISEDSRSQIDLVNAWLHENPHRERTKSKHDPN